MPIARRRYYDQDYIKSYFDDYDVDGQYSDSEEYNYLKLLFGEQVASQIKEQIEKGNQPPNESKEKKKWLAARAANSEKLRKKIKKLEKQREKESKKSHNQGLMQTQLANYDRQIQLLQAIRDAIVPTKNTIVREFDLVEFKEEILAMIENPNIKDALGKKFTEYGLPGDKNESVAVKIRKLNNLLVAINKMEAIQPEVREAISKKIRGKITELTAVAPKQITFSDIEGRLPLLQDIVDANNNILRIAIDANGKVYIHIEDPANNQLIINGDLFDHGPNSIYIGQLIANTIEHYKDHPNAVRVIIGNREANKWRFRTELEIESIKTEFARGMMDENPDAPSDESTPPGELTGYQKGYNLLAGLFNRTVGGVASVHLLQFTPEPNSSPKTELPPLPYWTKADNFYSYLYKLHEDNLHKQNALILFEKVKNDQAPSEDEIHSTKILYLKWMLENTMTSGKRPPFESDFDYRRFELMLIKYLGGYDNYINIKLYSGNPTLEEAQIDLMLHLIFRNQKKLTEALSWKYSYKKILLKLIKDVGGVNEYNKLVPINIATMLILSDLIKKYGSFANVNKMIETNEKFKQLHADYDVSSDNKINKYTLLALILQEFGSIQKFDEASEERIDKFKKRLFEKEVETNLERTFPQTKGKPEEQPFLLRVSSAETLSATFKLDQDMILHDLDGYDGKYKVSEYEVVESFLGAANDVVKEKRVHGPFYQTILQHGQLVHLDGNTLTLHGGVNLKSFTVPIFSPGPPIIHVLRNFADEIESASNEKQKAQILREWADALNAAWKFAIDHPDDELCKMFVMTISIANSITKLGDKNPFEGYCTTIAEIRKPELKDGKPEYFEGVEDAAHLLIDCGITDLNVGHKPHGSSPIGLQNAFTKDGKTLSINISDLTYGGGASCYLIKQGDDKTRKVVISNLAAEPLALSGDYPTAVLKFDADQLLIDHVLAIQYPNEYSYSPLYIFREILGLFDPKDEINGQKIGNLINILDEFLEKNSPPYTEAQLEIIRKIIEDMNDFLANKPVDICDAQSMEHGKLTGDIFHILQLPTDKSGFKVNGLSLPAAAVAQLISNGYLHSTDKDRPLTPPTIEEAPRNKRTMIQAIKSIPSVVKRRFGVTTTPSLASKIAGSLQQMLDVADPKSQAAKLKKLIYNNLVLQGSTDKEPTVGLNPIIAQIKLLREIIKEFPVAKDTEGNAPNAQICKIANDLIQNLIIELSNDLKAEASKANSKNILNLLRGSYKEKLLVDKIKEKFLLLMEAIAHSGLLTEKDEMELLGILKEISEDKKADYLNKLSDFMDVFNEEKYYTGPYAWSKEMQDVLGIAIFQYNNLRSANHTLSPTSFDYFLQSIEKYISKLPAEDRDILQNNFSIILQRHIDNINSPKGQFACLIDMGELFEYLIKELGDRIKNDEDSVTKEFKNLFSLFNARILDLAYDQQVDLLAQAEDLVPITDKTYSKAIHIQKLITDLREQMLEAFKVKLELLKNTIPADEELIRFHNYAIDLLEGRENNAKFARPLDSLAETIKDLTETNDALATEISNFEQENHNIPYRSIDPNLTYIEHLTKKLRENHDKAVKANNEEFSAKLLATIATDKKNLKKALWLRQTKQNMSPRNMIWQRKVDAEEERVINGANQLLVDIARDERELKGGLKAYAKLKSVQDTMQHMLAYKYNTADGVYNRICKELIGLQKIDELNDNSMLNHLAAFFYDGEKQLTLSEFIQSHNFKTIFNLAPERLVYTPDNMVDSALLKVYECIQKLFKIYPAYIAGEFEKLTASEADSKIFQRLLDDFYLYVDSAILANGIDYKFSDRFKQILEGLKNPDINITDENLTNYLADLKNDKETNPILKKALVNALKAKLRLLASPDKKQNLFSNARIKLPTSFPLSTPSLNGISLSRKAKTATSNLDATELTDKPKSFFGAIRGSGIKSLLTFSSRSKVNRRSEDRGEDPPVNATASWFPKINPFHKAKENLYGDEGVPEEASKPALESHTIKPTTKESKAIIHDARANKPDRSQLPSTSQLSRQLADGFKSLARNDTSFEYDNAEFKLYSIQDAARKWEVTVGDHEDEKLKIDLSGSEKAFIATIRSLIANLNDETCITLNLNFKMNREFITNFLLAIMELQKDETNRSKLNFIEFPINPEDSQVVFDVLHRLSTANEEAMTTLCAYFGVKLEGDKLHKLEDANGLNVDLFSEDLLQKHQKVLDV